MCTNTYYTILIEIEAKYGKYTEQAIERANECEAQYQRSTCIVAIAVDFII